MNPTKILIVDDDRTISRMAKLFLEKIAHYQVQVVNDSAVALPVARSFRPDAILVDIEMPGKDGGDVAAEVRADPLLRHIPMMFFTGLLSQAEAGQHEVMRGGVRYLAKPLSPNVLVAALTRLLASVPAPTAKLG